MSITSTLGTSTLGASTPGASTPGRSASSPPRRRWFANLISVIIFFVFVLAVENFLIILWGAAVETAGGGDRTYTWYGIYSIAMLCSAAASLVGGLVGFLFGVPQSISAGEQSRDRAASVREDRHQIEQPGSDRQPPQIERAVSRTAAVSELEQAPARRSTLRPNTNLESISDALTKGLLAIGASQLTNIGTWATSLADRLGPSFGPGTDGRVVAVSVVTYGAIAGLLFGYLATRIYLTPVFGDSDPAE